jgi:ankyrin repeat protein
MSKTLNNNFLRAAKRGTASRLHEFFERGADINSVDADGRTAFHLAAEHNTSTEVMELLVGEDTRANPIPVLQTSSLLNQTDNNGDSALDMVMENSNADVFKVMVMAGADFANG